uniref:Uncharacterized protein n=1 Tax=Oryza sativa subsp. japonica TaxID=39947 RepID=Q10DD7_ORYSJ|nr:hypothetical protein LOC_Os03g52220 [Oryza sativa Japonica Group]
MTEPHSGGGGGDWSREDCGMGSREDCGMGSSGKVYDIANIVTG